MTEIVFKDEKLINVLSNKKNVKDINSKEIQLNFEWKKLVSDIKEVTSISWMYEDIKDLSWIWIFINLQELYLNDNNIENITPLAKLINLNILDLSSNKIENITPLAKLEQLRLLDLSSNKIENITSLTNLKQLTGLSLIDNNIWILSKIYYNNETDNIIDKWFNINSEWNKIMITMI